MKLEKHCPRCDRTKHRDEFAKRKDGSLQSYCRSCYCARTMNFAYTSSGTKVPGEEVEAFEQAIQIRKLLFQLRGAA